MSAPQGGRLAAIDIIRGYCIVSMVSAHIAAGTLFARAAHAVPAFDGASGFVLLSGLVLGIVQSKRYAQQGLAAVERTSLRRIGVILLGQVGLVVLAILSAIVARFEHRNVPPISEMPPGDVVAGALNLQLAPPSGSVLRLYLVLLAIALLAYLLLSRGAWWAVVAGSVSIYGIGWLVPELTSFRGYNSDGLGANWACWQLLFIVALVIGWFWRSHDIPGRIQAHAVVVAGVTGMLIVAAFFGERIVPWLYVKTMLAPGQFINAYAVVLFLFVALTWLLRVIPRWVFRPVEIIGTRSLDSYIIQAGVAVIVPSMLLYSTQSGIAVAIALITLLTCWAWAEFRRSRYWPTTVRSTASAHQPSASAPRGQQPQPPGSATSR
ncbi:OpgC domain-containing protein [Microbacterium sp. NE2HP2]|uniref:OpgC domain-containing protein n=1 Tax=Microbacterium plantarum TaxID=1816425 RepID=UPI0023663B11|nr:OpgC domain-containing protein [Microbacterium plantarum]MDD7945822.1 OpgC domain-containing protein [Microbacterium plantarum]